MLHERIRIVLTFICIALLLVSGYYAFYWELIYWNKPLFSAIEASWWNYIIFTVSLTILTIIIKLPTRTKRKPVKRKRKKGKNKGKVVPESWGSKNSKATRKAKFSFPSIPSPKKVRVPQLRGFKRVLAGILTIANFLVMCATLLANPTTQPLFWLFVFNFFILMDYMWKTGKQKI